MLRSETGRLIADFIFQDLLCRWGGIYELVTDNGTPFLNALEILAEKYNVKHIRISGYNSRANGLIERKHYDFRNVLYKIADGDSARWSQSFYAVLWAMRVTTTRTLGQSPYLAATGIHPILPFDIDEATYLLPPPDSVLTTEDLIVRRGKEFLKREADLEALQTRVHEA